MFDFKRKTQPPLSPLSVETGEEEQPSQPGAPGRGFDVSGVKVHVMPGKFLLGGEKKIITQAGGRAGRKITGFKKNIIIGAGIGLVVVGMLSLAAWFLLKTIETPATKNLLVNQNVSNTNVNQQHVVPPTTPSSLEPEAKVCSPENCELCNSAECLNLASYCHLEDLCLTQGGAGQESCPHYLCLTGAKEEKLEEVEPEAKELIRSRDSDNDLLTDVEEGLFGTNPLETDTDGDGYNDGEEVVNLYNPTLAGVGSANLSESNLIKTYTNTKYGYSIYHPATWQEQPLGQLQQEVVFRSNTGEFVEVIVQDNYAGFLTAKDWYLSQNPSLKASDLEEILIGNWSGVRSPDKLNVYLVNNNYIYTITYNIGLKQELDYKSTYEMMLKSFRLFESPL